MAKGLNVGVDNIARNVNNVWVGVDDTARSVKKMWVGINGIAQLCYMKVTPTTITLHGEKNDTIGFTYNNETYSEIFPSGATSKTITLNMVDETAEITFRGNHFNRTQTITAGVTNTVYVRPTYSFLWCGYRDTSLTTYTFARYSNDDHASILSDNTAKLYGLDQVKGYGGISAYVPSVVRDGHRIYFLFDMTYSGSGGYVRYGNSTSSTAKPDPNTSQVDYTSTFTSNSTIISATNRSDVLAARLTDGSTYAALAYFGVVPQTGYTHDTITVILKGFGID